MTLKETDNHSAQGIFESLMLDPDLEIGEGQTREEAAKHEAEYRARQHFNNMRALSLGTEESSVKSLLDFLSRPSSIWSNVVDIMKASYATVTSGSYHQQTKKAHPHAESEISLSEEGQKFVKFLQQNHMPAATVDYVKSLAKVWREDSDAADEDGWIQYVTENIGTHDELATQLASANNGGFQSKDQKVLVKALHENGYHAYASAPKAKTINNKFFEAKKYGSNTKDDLEQTATLDNVNAALQKMGRKEKIQFGASNKVKFDEETGNVQQWKAYKEAPENDKRKHTRIVRGQIHKGASMTDEILSSQMEDFSVAEILRALFHHTDMDGGQHDVTPGEAVQNNAKDEANEEKLEAYDEANKSVVAADEASGQLEPITNDELDKLMHQFSAKAGSSAEEIDKALPFNVQWWDAQHSPEAIDMKGMAQEYGLVDGKGHFKPEHLQGLHDAIKAGAITTGHIMKGWPPKKDAAGKALKGSPPDKSGSPLHYSLVVHKAGQESGLHAYINHKGLKPVVPSKTANQIADSVPEDVEEEADEFNMLDVADMAEENNEDFPVENHVSDKVNHLQTLHSVVDNLFGEMAEAYMNSDYSKTYDSWGGLNKTGAAVSALFDRFWSKGHPGFGAEASEDIAGRLQLNPQLIVGLPGLLNNSKFVNYGDLANSNALSPNIQQHVKDVWGLHAMAAVLNDSDKIRELKKAGTLGAVLKSTMEQVHTVINNPNIPALGDMHPTYLTHSLEEKFENFSTVLTNTLGGPLGMPGSLKVVSSVLGDVNGASSLAKTFGSELNDYHKDALNPNGIYDNIDDLDNEIDKAYMDTPHSETPDNLQGEEPNLHISGPAHVEMMNHVDNYIDAGLGKTDAGIDDQVVAVSAIKDVLQGELSSMATQPLGLKEKQQIFHNMHTALDAGIVDHGNVTEDFTDITEDGKHSLNSLHNILNNTFNNEMGDPMSSGDWDAIKGYHAAKSLLDSKLAGKPINSMGALHLDNSALDALSGLGGSMAEYQDDDDLGEQLIDHPELAHNIQMFMGDLLSEYSPEDLKKLSPEVDMLHEHLEHSAYAPTGEMKNTPGYKYAQEHHGRFASQIKDDHEANIASLAAGAVNVGKLAASPYPQKGIEQHYQDALDAMHNGIQEAVASGAMTEGQAQQLATDAGVDKKHFTGSGAVDEPSTDLADTKEVNMEPDDESEVQQSIEDASHNLNIAVASGNTDAQNEASDMLTDLMDSASVHGIGEDEFNELLEGHLSYDAYDMHVGGKEPSPIHSEGQSDLGDDYDLGEDDEDDPQWEAWGENSGIHGGAEESGWGGEKHDIGDFHPETGELQVPGKNANDVRKWAKGLEKKHGIDLVGGPTGTEPHDDIYKHFGFEGGHMGGNPITANHIADYVKEKTGEGGFIPVNVSFDEDQQKAFDEKKLGEPKPESVYPPSLDDVQTEQQGQNGINVRYKFKDGQILEQFQPDAKTPEEAHKMFIDGLSTQDDFEEQANEMQSDTGGQGFQTQDKDGSWNQPHLKPEEEPKVEEELGKVPDADASQEKQKQEIMQEIFNDDFKDSDDAKTYKAYLDKQKSEKIDALHETHVIGNLVKKNIKAKADKAKQKTQSQKDEQKTSDKEEADQAKEEEKQQKEDDKAKQKEADTVPHKSGEIEKKIEEGQNPKQMARENMVHQHQHEDIMSAKANKEYTDAFHKFDAMGVDMDELLDEKDKHGDAYGSEEHLQAAMKEDAVKEDTAENYKNHIESNDHEHVKNREKAFKSGQPGKFTTFDKNGNPEKDLHHTKDEYGQSSLEEHEHGEGPKAEKFDTQTGEEHGTHTLHGEPTEDAKKYKEAEQKHKDAKDEYNFFHNEAKNLHEDLEKQKKKLDEVDDDSPDAEGEKSEINDKISQIEKDKETNLNARVEADGERHKAQKALEELPKPKEPSEDDVPKTGPPDPEVARRKMAEGYIWHEETRSWIMRENMKAIQGGHGAKDATMIHGGSTSGTKPGQMVKPFAANEDGSPSNNHFVVSHAGVHKVGSPVAKPPGASSHQHTTEASLGHALKDTKTGPNGAVHLPQAFGAGGALASSGLATAGNHVTQQPKAKGAIGSAMDSLKGGAMDKLKDIIGLEEIEDESALDKLLVKYK